MATREDNSSLQQKTNSLRRIMGVIRVALFTANTYDFYYKWPRFAGAGFAIALACDMRVATENAKFVTAFSKIAFSGDFGGSYFLTKIIGTAKARELFYLSDTIDAKKAHELGIINNLMANEIGEYATSLKNKFRNLAPIAVRYMKKNLNIAEVGDLNLSLNQEALHMMICSETEDHKNGKSICK